LRERKGDKARVTLKMFKEDWLINNWKGTIKIDNEVELLRELSHPNICKILEFDNQGEIEEPTGEKITDIAYILLENFPGRLDDFCKGTGPMEEKGGLYFMRQLVSVFTYLHQQEIAHLDFKLENIFIDKRF